MKLDYSHSGRQFFFITLTTAGRAKILSRLVSDAARPQLNEVGEVVKMALLALHQVNPAVTVSDFVIMPDHIHFILIVDYERDMRISPLYLAHRLIDGVEIFLERGAASSAALRDTLAKIIREAIAVETATWRAGGKKASSARCAVFDRSCYIELSFDSRQLRAIRHYIKLNPARALWKLRHPDWFRRVEIPAERVLGAAGRGNGRGYAPNPETGSAVIDGAARNGGSGQSPVLSSRFHAMGDITLLGSPFFFHVRLTLKKTLAEHEPAIAEIVDEARRGRIPVSGFISPGEREALRRLKATPGARFIKLLPHALPPRYDPSAEDSREIAAGRLLLLSGSPETPPISALEMRRNRAAASAFRRNCLAMNDLAAALCSRR